MAKVAVLFCAVYTFASNYNNGNNLVNELIFSRLEYDSQEGTIAGDNRASNSLKQYYENLLQMNSCLVLEAKDILMKHREDYWQVRVINFSSLYTVLLL